MAAPSYTTDLTTLNTAEATTNYTEPTGAAAGGIAVAEVDFFIQGTGCISKTFNATGLGGLHYNNGAGVTIPTDGAYMAWIYYGAPNAVATEANGGMRLTIGSGVGDYKSWYVRGSDTYAYGGWVCVPVDPAATADVTTGTPSATLQYFGYVVNSSNAVAKGNPFGFDAIRYGRCEARMSGGETANYATFSGYATENDLTTNRWGLIQAIPGGYQVQGLVILGYLSAVDFRESNTTVLISNTKKVSANFNAFEIRQSTSRVDWTNISFLALGTVSRGNLVTTDNADINIIGCTFTEMGTFGFQSNSTINSSTFRNCNLITQSSAQFTGCIFDSTNDAVKTFLSNNPNNITDCSFISSGTKHAIEITTPGTYTFIGNTFTGYAGTNGSTGNEAIYNNSGGAVTLNISGGGISPTYRNGASATTTVNASVSVTITVLNSSQSPVVGASVYVIKNSDSSVIINTTTNASGVATGSTSAGSGAITIRIRKSSVGSTRYIPNESSGTVGGIDFSSTVILVADTIVT